MGLFNPYPESLQSSAVQAINSNTTASSLIGTYQVDTSAGDVTLILPHTNKMWTVKKFSTDSNKLILLPESGLIENKANYSTTSTTRPSYNVRDDGANFWFV